MTGDGSPRPAGRGVWIPSARPDPADRSGSVGVLSAQLLVLAKEPLPGRVKTRLSPALSPADAAAVGRAALLDTLSAVTRVRVLRSTVVLDGSPDGWLPPGVAVLPQRGGDLSARLAGAFEDAYAALHVPMLLIGMDTPQVTPALLSDALARLLTPGVPAVLGRADDGGWWALGLHRPAPGVFDGVPMSTDRAGEVQHERLVALGLPPDPLPGLRDLDHVEDVRALAALLHADAALPVVAARLGLGS